MTTVYAVEMVVLVSGLPNTLYFSSDSAFMTAPTDTPANTAFESRILKPGNYERHCWQRGTTRGTSSRAYGAITLANSDGALDYLMRATADGQSVIIRQGETLAPYPGGWTTLFTGTIRRIDVLWAEINVQITDRQGNASDLSFQNTKYLGTNSGATGVEGSPSDLWGKPKPKLRGTAANISPPCVNTSTLIYQIDDGSAILPMTISGVWVKGVQWAFGVARASLAAMQATGPTAGTYDTYAGVDGWFIRLGSSPPGTMTVTVSEGTVTTRTTAQLVYRIATTEGGLPGSAIVGVSALDAAKPYECGFWSGVQETTVGQVLDLLLDSANAFFTDSRSTGLTMGWLQDPATLPSVATIYDWQIKNHDGLTISGSNDPGVGIRISDGVNGINGVRYQSGQDATVGLPVWRVLLNFDHNFTVMSASDTDGTAATPAEVAYVIQEYRTAIAADAAVKTNHLKTPEFTVNTQIRSSTDATTEATSQLNLRKVSRWVVEIPLDPQFSNQIDLGQAFTLTMNQTGRFGWANGMPLLCIGLIEDFGDATTPAISTIIAWG